jgi:hypothetical protein
MINGRKTARGRKLLGNQYGILNLKMKKLYIILRPKKKNVVFPVARPTLFFSADPKIFIDVQKKNGARTEDWF